MENSNGKYSNILNSSEIQSNQNNSVLGQEYEHIQRMDSYINKQNFFLQSNPQETTLRKNQQIQQINKLLNIFNIQQIKHLAKYDSSSINQIHSIIQMLFYNIKKQQQLTHDLKKKLKQCENEVIKRENKIDQISLQIQGMQRQKQLLCQKIRNNQEIYKANIQKLNRDRELLNKTIRTLESKDNIFKNDMRKQEARIRQFEAKIQKFQQKVEYKNSFEVHNIFKNKRGSAEIQFEKFAATMIENKLINFERQNQELRQILKDLMNRLVKIKRQNFQNIIDQNKAISTEQPSEYLKIYKFQIVKILNSLQEKLKKQKYVAHSQNVVYVTGKNGEKINELIEMQNGWRNLFEIQKDIVSTSLKMHQKQQVTSKDCNFSIGETNKSFINSSILEDTMEKIENFKNEERKNEQNFKKEIQYIYSEISLMSEIKKKIIPTIDFNNEKLDN